MQSNRGASSGNLAAGKRLRTDGMKRTEEECRQMLRLAEHENKELKNSLRYVEIQLAKSRENYKMLTSKYEDAQADIQSGQEQIARQSNINHAQAEQIGEMGKKLDNVADDQREMFEKSKAKMQAYQNEIDMREAEI